MVIVAVKLSLGRMMYGWYIYTCMMCNIEQESHLALKPDSNDVTKPNAIFIAFKPVCSVCFFFNICLMCVFVKGGGLFAVLLLLFL